MGCDIHSFAEVKQNNKWIRITNDIFPEYKDNKTSEPFSCRNYSVFAFLADVRNYDCCEPISKRKGLPDDSEYLNSKYDTDIYAYYTGTVKEVLLDDFNYHSHSYLTLKELLDFDYDKTFWNRRVMKQTGVNSWSGRELAEEGEGKIISYRDNLGETFFENLEVLKTLGNPEDVRIIFWFDN